MTKIEVLIKKSRYSVKSRFKESKCTDGGHSLNRDFTVLCTYSLLLGTLEFVTSKVDPLLDEVLH